jgi:hypothetical protein
LAAAVRLAFEVVLRDEPLRELEALRDDELPLRLLRDSAMSVSFPSVAKLLPPNGRVGKRDYLTMKRAATGA